MLSERVKDWSKNWKQQGIEEGRQEGIEQGKLIGLQEGLQKGETEFLLYLLEQRFGSIDETIRKRIEAADSPTLLRGGSEY